MENTSINSSGVGSSLLARLAKLKEVHTPYKPFKPNEYNEDLIISYFFRLIKKQNHKFYTEDELLFKDFLSTPIILGTFERHNTERFVDILISIYTELYSKLDLALVSFISAICWKIDLELPIQLQDKLYEKLVQWKAQIQSQIHPY